MHTQVSLYMRHLSIRAKALSLNFISYKNKNKKTLENTPDLPRSSHYITLLARVSLELYGSEVIGDKKQVGGAACSEG